MAAFNWSAPTGHPLINDKETPGEKAAMRALLHMGAYTLRNGAVPGANGRYAHPDGGDVYNYHANVGGNPSVILAARAAGQLAKYGELVDEYPTIIQEVVDEITAEGAAAGEEECHFTPEDAAMAMDASLAAEEMLDVLIPQGGGGRHRKGARSGKGTRRARRVQRGGFRFVKEFFKRIMLLTCRRAARVAEDEVAERDRRQRVLTAVAEIENNNPAYMAQVRNQWKAKLRGIVGSFLLTATAVDLASGRSLLISTLTTIITGLGALVPDVTFMGAIGGVAGGAAALAGAAAPVAATAASAYLGISFVKEILHEAAAGLGLVGEINSGSFNRVLQSAIAQTRAAAALPEAERTAVRNDAILRVCNYLISFYSRVLFFGNAETLFRIIGIPTQREIDADAAQREENRAAANAWKQAVEARQRAHPSRQAGLAQAAIEARRQAEREEAARARSIAVQTDAVVARGAGGGGAGGGGEAAVAAARAALRDAAAGEDAAAAGAVAAPAGGEGGAAAQGGAGAEGGAGGPAGGLLARFAGRANVAAYRAAPAAANGSGGAASGGSGGASAGSGRGRAGSAARPRPGGGAGGPAGGEARRSQGGGGRKRKSRKASRKSRKGRKGRKHSGTRKH